jgi:phosphoribosylformylglycinamidine synthase
MGKIAAVCNTKGNVMGMMPHPERGSDIDLVPPGFEGNSIMMFKSLLHYLK